MSVVSELPHLIRLLDDDTDVVRSAVRQRLEGMRKDLPAHLDALDLKLSKKDEQILSELLAPSCRDDLVERWLGWQELSSANQKIESALSSLSAFLSGWKVGPRNVAARLDALAREVEESAAGQPLDCRLLAERLFAGRGDQTRFRGNSADYYSPNNSNLLWVLEHGLGNPLSLCVIYRLVGLRLGLEITGCNFPGHFLARVQQGGQVWLVDCFNRGRFMLAADVARHHPAANPGMEELVRAEASPESIIMRFLRNLDDAFDRSGLSQERQLMRRLAVKMMDQPLNDD
jgi:regulator of sirC expression with transglutaminase-like and TPR domain